MSRGEPPAAAAGLVREDGSVVIPAKLAGAVLRILLRDVTARLPVDKGKVSPPVQSLLWALNEAAGQAEALAGSEDGTPGAGPVSVEISTSQAAEALGCSPEYARRLARSGRLPARRLGRTWLIAEAAIVAPETESAA